MELLAIWVEDYMGIKDQTFVFNNQCKFKFDANYVKDAKWESLYPSVTLTIKPNLEFVNIFQPVLSSVTAIIGQNGCGKTRVTKLLRVIKANQDIPSNILIVYKREGDTYISQYVGRSRSIKSLALTIHVDPQLLNENKFFDCVNEHKGIYYTFEHALSQTNLVFYSNALSDQNDRALFADSSFTNVHFFNGSVDNQLRTSLSAENVATYSSLFAIDPKSHHFDPISIYYKSKLKTFIDFILYLNENPELKESLSESLVLPTQLLIDLDETFFRENIEQLDLEDIYLDELRKGYNRNNFAWKPTEAAQKTLIWKVGYSIVIYLLNKMDIIKVVPNITKHISNVQNISETISILADQVPDSRQIKAILLPSYNKLVEVAKDITLTTRSYASSFLGYSVNISEKTLPFIYAMRDINEYLNRDIISYRWKESLSAGEEAILNQFAQIAKESHQIGMRDSIFLIDEGELYLHPKWQISYINNIVKLIKFISSIGRSYQLIFTSHSPFVISDLTKDNIIFLKKVDDRPTVVALDEMENTFAGNILALYSNAYFLDSLMGKFAYNKIQQIIDYIRDNDRSVYTTDEEVLLIIEKIGEPVIRDQLINILRNREIYNLSGQ